MRCWILNQATNWHKMLLWIHMDPGQIGIIAESPVAAQHPEIKWIYSPRQHRIGLSVQRFSNIIQYLVIEVE